MLCFYLVLALLVQATALLDLSFSATPAQVQFLPESITPTEVSILKSAINNTCSWKPSYHHVGVDDCTVNVPHDIVSTLSVKLLGTVPLECTVALESLPVRRFHSQSLSAPSHVDRGGQSWTVLLYLSEGTTHFDGMGLAQHAAPGDVIAWWNSGEGPRHRTGMPNSGDKLVVSLGIFASDVKSCNGIQIKRAMGIGSECYEKKAGWDKQLCFFIAGLPLDATILVLFCGPVCLIACFVGACCWYFRRKQKRELTDVEQEGDDEEYE